MGRVVLVTGIASNFASLFANRLAESKGIDKVVGIDTILPKGQLDGVKFVRADIRTPVVGKVIAVEEVDTVVHLGVGPPNRGRSSAAKELNVIGTMQLLAACQRAAGVKKFVLGSSTAVYGTSPRDPAMFTESLLARAGVRSGFPKDIVEVESYVRGFARRRPEIIITTLRGAQLLHPEMHTPMREYFDNPVLPTALGYDPRLQFLHLEDGMNVLTRVRAARSPRHVQRRRRRRRDAQPGSSQTRQARHPVAVLRVRRRRPPRRQGDGLRHLARPAPPADVRPRRRHVGAA